MSPAVSTSKTEPAYQVLSFQPHQEAQARKYITRKSHRKSRGGCLGCKLSRIKVRVDLSPDPLPASPRRDHQLMQFRNLAVR